MFFSLSFYASLNAFNASRTLKVFNDMKAAGAEMKLYVES